jgi:hypothetical protein
MLQTEFPMKKPVNAQWTPPDQPLRDASPTVMAKTTRSAIQLKVPQLRIQKLLSMEG